MTEYIKHGVNLSDRQKLKLAQAFKDGISTSIRLTKNNLHGNDNLALTQTQINQITNAKNGVQLNISLAQLKYQMNQEKTGGFLPLLTLIPLLFSGLAAAGGVAGGVASVVNSSKQANEQARHNRAVEEQLKPGSGVVSDVVGKIPVIGNFLGSVLQKIGLGYADINEFQNGGCVCKKNFRVKQIGRGLYLEPSQGNGLFLEPWRG
jgi:hypothetical protein